MQNADAEPTERKDEEPREASKATSPAPAADLQIRVANVAPLLFFSGLCALVYQVAWLRELRLIFGASTAASAAVLAVFMGGLGVGGMMLGKRADASPNPLRMYAHLELAVALASAATPLLVMASRKLYIVVGGSTALGLTGATLVRIVLTVVILGVPTFVMGGTLPAAAKAVSKATDARRRGVATLYAVNTLGAVTGAFAANFFMLEVFGTRLTLWLACLINALVGMSARALARRHAPVSSEEPAGLPVADTSVLPKRLFWFPPAAAAVAGFSFLLMELVWYRMLSPILGGSSYSFGLILCVALFGIGVGGGIYAAVGLNRPATLTAFAYTCALEALCIMLPFAIGDGVAVATVVLRAFGSLGFAGHVATWTVVTSFVVLPAAVVSGYQFPLIIALFGKGDASLGRHVGLAYATNTVGSILGSLAGGFGLIPLLSAPGCWKAVGALLAAAAIATALCAVMLGQRRLSAALAGAVGLLAAALLFARGPTSAWRHAGIGAGRSMQVTAASNRNEVIESLRLSRRWMAWEADGVESAVAVERVRASSFLVNGKSDGNALLDAGTQVMGGLVGAALIPQVRDAFVIGLGTGSTAGWLGRLPEIERVDVAELEPEILRVARECRAVNEDVLDNPKVHVAVGDARELLLTSRHGYDLIFSEPSNPYRAGIASLFTAEFYEAAASVLRSDGVFLQWLQLYDVDGAAVQTAVATLRSVFPFVSVWRTDEWDLILVATRQAQTIDGQALRARVASDPFRRAMLAAWRVDGIEGLLAHHVANPQFTRRMIDQRGSVNTDDINLLEYAFARTVGRSRMLDQHEILKLARRLQLDRPDPLPANVDWTRVDMARALDLSTSDEAFVRAFFAPEAQRIFRDNLRRASGDSAGLRNSFGAVAPEALPFGAVAMYAEAFAALGQDLPPALIDPYRAVSPADAAILDAQLLVSRARYPEASEKLRFAFERHRVDPWPRLMSTGLSLAQTLASKDARLAPALLDSLGQPFAAMSMEQDRHLTRLRIALSAALEERCVEVFAPFEPNCPWERWFLERRFGCYRRSGSPLAAKAERELVEFLENETIGIGAAFEGAPEIPVPSSAPPPEGSSEPWSPPGLGSAPGL